MLLTINKISKAYGTPGTDGYQQVLGDLSLEADHGESLAITGPSGSGKSTLLNLIGSLDKPDRGSIVYQGNDITQLSGKDLAGFRNKQIGFVFQQHHLLPQCTLMENVLLPVLPVKAGPEAAERAESLIKRVGLWEHRHKKPGVLSGGECQRTAVVRALINAPGLLLADEPTGALDHDNSLQLMALLLELNQEEKVSLIVVTHSLELAEKMQSRYKLDKGKLQRIPGR
jgi:lipoprotein-releasing system ATP-binding protein